LVLGRFLGFGLDIELALEADGLLVVGGQVQEQAEVIQFAFHIRVPEAGVTLAPAPEHVTGAVQFVGDLEGFLDLSGGVGERLGVATGGGPMHETRMGKQAGRAPEQSHPGPLLLLLEHPDNRVQVPIGLAQGPAFGRNVPVVERIKRSAQLFEEFKGDPDAGLGHFHRVSAVFPGAHGGAGAEHVGQLPPDRVPISDREAQVLLHAFALDQLVGVVMLESERLFRVRAFVLDFGDSREECFRGFFHAR
jgi:hypothetical protein